MHDIGKNIVKVILENYGFEVIDLGRDVPVETVVNTVREKNVHLVGLSALMTTTLKSMEETIAALHEAGLDCKIMVGGAVLTPEYAEKIGADWYAKDAKRQRGHRQGIFRGAVKERRSGVPEAFSSDTNRAIPSPALLPFGQQGPTPADGLRRNFRPAAPVSWSPFENT